MPVKKTAAKKTPTKKKPTVKEEDTNTIKTTFRVAYPDSGVYIMFSNMSIDDLAVDYGDARLEDEVLTINVGLTEKEGTANYYDDVDHFVPMLIPAKYIQSIRGYKKDEG